MANPNQKPNPTPAEDADAAKIAQLEKELAEVKAAKEKAEAAHAAVLANPPPPPPVKLRKWRVKDGFHSHALGLVPAGTIVPLDASIPGAPGWVDIENNEVVPDLRTPHFGPERIEQMRRELADHDAKVQAIRDGAAAYAPTAHQTPPAAPERPASGGGRANDRSVL